MKLFRTLMFAPCTRPELMAKAQEGQADALIFDLEDSVPVLSKATARQNLAAILAAGLKKPAFVRLNHPRAGDCQADLQALGDRPVPNLVGVILPKAEHAADIATLSAALEAIETRWAWPVGILRILPLVETCLGLRNTYELAQSSPRVCGMSLASAEQGDFMVDLGGHWTPSSMALAYPRSKMVVDARAAGLPWLVDGVFMNLGDAQALENECRLARELGFVGKMAIHPSQVEVMHRVFSPTEEELQHARGLLEAFRAAEAQGIGAVRYQGMMVDYANVRLAERILALSQGAAP
ncbi:MAG: CoA ester lyase [Alphaproteobacteria bacterium]|nr:CoA ester lyase [Alphaproteobacteria bacterium]